MLGILLFQVLDYGLSESEEQLLSEQLGQLIERMTSVNDEHDGSDEGIVDDSGFDKESLTGNDSSRQITVDEIIKVIQLIFWCTVIVV